MNKQNIYGLKSQVTSLGFEDFENELYFNMSFITNHFVIHRRLTLGHDVINCYLHFERLTAQNAYVFQYYDAMLRKLIVIHHTKINDVNTAELEKRMNLIDWKIDYTKDSFKDKSIEDEDWNRETEIEQIIMELASLASSATGKDISNKLKIKYWADNPPQQFIDNFSSLKTQFEITQRFYLFDQQPGITIEEAYRYLNNRWMEKKLFSKKKPVDISLEERTAEGEQNSSGSGKTSFLKKKRNKQTH